MTTQEKRLLCSYYYDPLDRLINHAQPESLEQRRFYCKNRLASEIQGLVAHSVFQLEDRLLAQQRRQAATVDTTLLAIDQQKSVLQMLKANGRPHPVAYSAYGYQYAEIGLPLLLGFNGERPDPVTGHYLMGNGYRAFNPVLMRFNSPDSWSPFGDGGLNAYCYCLGDPINKTDVNGHFPTALIKRIPSKKIRNFLFNRKIVSLEKQQAKNLANHRSEILQTLLETGPQAYNKAPNLQELSTHIAKKNNVHQRVPTDKIPNKIRARIDNFFDSAQWTRETIEDVQEFTAWVHSRELSNRWSPEFHRYFSETLYVRPTDKRNMEYKKIISSALNTYPESHKTFQQKIRYLRTLAR